MRILVSGLLAQYPLGGVAWDYLQYVVGLREMGHDVYYVEDTGQWPYDPASGGLVETGEGNARYLAALMERFGLAGRWAYCFPWQDQWFGLSEARRREIFASAELFLNVSGTAQRPAEIAPGAVRAYIDSDPVFTQAKLARGQRDFRKLVDQHDVCFSFGEDFSEAVPATPYTWLPTRQPVVVDAWRGAPAPDALRLTSVMNWTSYNDVSFQGVRYGQKDAEFMRFLELPRRVPEVTFEMAIALGKTRQAPLGRLTRAGWKVVAADRVSATLDAYRGFIQGSAGEWSVAKNGYVVGQAGWFSCRSACYLAAGRPVLVQDTGFRRVLPSGEGILAFSDLDSAVAAAQDFVARRPRHEAAAAEIAAACFDHRVVLESLLARAFAPVSA